VLSLFFRLFQVMEPPAPAGKGRAATPLEDDAEFARRPDHAASVLGPCAAGQAHLRILSTTDLHCHVHPYDYYADRENHTMGLARTASIVTEIRAEATNTLTVDNGDYFQGNPMGDYIAYSRGMSEGDLHPIIAGMNALGFDAGTLGNHEFNYGVPFMDKVNAGADFPIVCANFARSAGRHPARGRTAPAALRDPRSRTDRRRRRKHPSASA
jgi:2',3'-cyclic-nucleotide 2'-phosphodiesterase (5'-nucleotidase family)